jgi:RNA polymerase sigma-70 factor (ECF subfamily)
MRDADSDQELFVRYQARHQRRLFSYILTLVPNWNDAEEVFQETSLVLWRKFATFEPGTSYVSWATRVAFLEVKKFRERGKKNPPLFSGDLLAMLATDAAEMRDVLTDQQEALQHCVDKLPKDDRWMITTRYQRGGSARTISESTGRSLESVCNSLRRIRTALLRCVRRQELNPAS